MTFWSRPLPPFAISPLPSSLLLQAPIPDGSILFYFSFLCMEINGRGVIFPFSLPFLWKLCFFYSNIGFHFLTLFGPLPHYFLFGLSPPFLPLLCSYAPSNLVPREFPSPKRRRILQEPCLTVPFFGLETIPNILSFVSTNAGDAYGLLSTWRLMDSLFLSLSSFPVNFVHPPHPHTFPFYFDPLLWIVKLCLPHGFISSFFSPPDKVARIPFVRANTLSPDFLLDSFKTVGP